MLAHAVTYRETPANSRTNRREPGVVDWTRLIRAEYLEMPGLHLTNGQVRRLFGLDQVTCDAILGALVDVNFLRRTPQGAYVLSHDGR